ncbi:MAG: DUF6760 family protein [Methanosarcina sp.]
MRESFRGGRKLPGGIRSYPLDKLYEEVAFLAYYFHWAYETIMNMEHRERQRWCQEVSRINKELNSGLRNEEAKSKSILEF